jgi:Putative small multi-drug export protein
METGTSVSLLQHLGITLLICIGLVLVLPLVLTLLLALPVTSTLALLAMTLVIEYGAAPGGIALGLPPGFVLVVLCSVALGMTLMLYSLFDTLATSSKRVDRFLARSQKRADQSSILANYGIFGLVPCVMILGFYVCPAIAWICGWRRDYAILLTMTGYILISIATILVASDVITILHAGG